MAQNIKDQAPTLIVTALLIVGFAIWIRHDDHAANQTLIRQLQDQNDALKTAVDDSRQRTEATAELLRSAVARADSGIFRPDVEMEKLNSQRMTALADAIAKKVQPELAVPQAPEEAKRIEDAQVERISDRMVEKMQPVLEDAAKNQHLATDEAVRKEFERNQRLSADLLASQAAAKDAIKVSHELGSLYINSFDDQGVVTRVLALPAGMMHDALTFSVFSSGDRKKAEKEVQTKIDQIEKQMDQIQADAADVKS